MKVTIPAALAAFVALAPTPVRGQSPGTLELGAYGVFTRFDHTLHFDNVFGVGGTAGVFVLPDVAIEGSASVLSPKRTGSTSITVIPLRLRALYVRPVAERLAVLLGAGGVYNHYRSGLIGWEVGLSGLLGLRADFGDRFSGRVDLVEDFLPSPLNESTTVTWNGNFSVQAGLQVRFGAPGVRDGDHDGVVDGVDACPNTPRGEAVDGRGCPIPKDSDGDGVVDTADLCPNTPPGDKVNLNGCSLPKDADGDGVSDSADRCPNTPAGESVDTRGCPLDTDGDGVPDAADRCPNTAPGQHVDAAGCPLPVDSDGDGVLDAADKCPGTPAGQKVDAVGCALLFTGVQRTVVLEGVNFETGSATLTGPARDVLDRVAASLVAYPDLRVEVAGYTDSRGGSAVNLRLSLGRAQSVRTYLIAHGVEPSRLRARGYGASHPIDTNTTGLGRARNRRVELHRLN
jgi:outer membrane protein OmpA-like peptidoglycan-associated protein